jgi:hypothetical protein
MQAGTVIAGAGKLTGTQQKLLAPAEVVKEQTFSITPL